VADDLHLAADPARFIDNTNRGLFHRDVEADKVLHAALPFLMLVAVWTDHVYHQLGAQHPQVGAMVPTIHAPVQVRPRANYRKRAMWLA